MTIDANRYREEVLKPARKSGRSPADLYVRYGFTGRLPSDDGFATQIDAVVQIWKKQRSKPGWGNLVDELLGKHEELKRAGELTPAAFRARRERERAAAAKRLADLVRQLDVTHVGPATVAWLRGKLGDEIDDAQLRQELVKARITVIDQLPEIPASGPASYPDLGTALRRLGKQLSAEVVFGSAAVRAGFRVLGGFQLGDGRRLNAPALSALEDESSKMAHSNPHKTPTGTVLSILNGALGDGSLQRLLLWEVVGPLRGQTGVLPQKAIAAQAAETGLDREEAGILAAALAGEGAAEGWRRQIEDDLAAGWLRSAQRQAARLPAADELRVRVDAASSELAELLARADAVLSAGRSEEAARMLAAALARAKDDEDLAERLAQIAPPPPREPTAAVDADRVLVTWQASASKTGQVRYQVARGTGRSPRSPAEGAQIAVPDGELHATDQDPPPGEDLYYAVFASRGGQRWSAPAVAARLVFAPDVTNIELQEAADSIGAAWRPPNGAAEIRVTRVVNGRETPVNADMTGFNDAGLTPGVEYRYRISAVFLAFDGSARTSAGKVIRAVPTPEPLPVEALAIQAIPPVIKVSWVPPPFGRVELWIGRAEPRWPPGAEISPSELAAFGSLASGAQRPAGGRVSAQLRMTPGRRYLLAVTKAGQRAVAGAWVKLDLAAPVSELSAKRLLDDVELSWEWPDGAVDSIIAWPGGERRCSRRVYHDEGGITVPVGPGEAVVTVSAVHPDPASELVAMPISVTVPARKAKVSYRWLKAGSRRRLLELNSDQPCELPELVIVRSTAAFPPDEAADGIEVKRLPPTSITPGSPLKLPVDLPKGATGFLACFTTNSRDTRLLLYPPPPNEMRIR